jgi:hypothetical protein
MSTKLSVKPLCVIYYRDDDKPPDPRLKDAIGRVVGVDKDFKTVTVRIYGLGEFVVPREVVRIYG